MPSDIRRAQDPTDKLNEHGRSGHTMERRDERTTVRKSPAHPSISRASETPG